MARYSAQSVLTPEDIPVWITSYYPYEHQNMNRLAKKMDKVIVDLSPYIEDGFCANHIKEPLNMDYDKPLFEGLWHLHVLWCLYVHGIGLEKPNKAIDDDIIISYQGKQLGIETTFSGWGDPRTSLYRMYSEGTIDMYQIDELISRQAIEVVKRKEEKLAKRKDKSDITRIVALNEVFLANGFREWNKSPAERRRAIQEKTCALNTSGINGIIYDYVSYHDYFQDSRLTLFPFEENNDDLANLEAILKD